MAIIKATTSQFHVVPKEKHVRSEWRLWRPWLPPSAGTHSLPRKARFCPPFTTPVLPPAAARFICCSPEAGGAPEPFAARRASSDFGPPTSFLRRLVSTTT